MKKSLKSAARLMLVFVVGALLSARAWSEQKPIEMIVSLKTAKTIVIRQAPSVDADVIAFVENGKPVFRKGLDESNGFVMVQLADGRTGWVKASFLVQAANSVVAPEEPKDVALTASDSPTVAMPVAEVSTVTTTRHLLLAAFVGFLFGFLVGGKSGMVYATKSIHERYEVIN